MKSTRFTLLAGAAIVALATAASAADLPQRMAPPPYVAPLFTWTGFYVGVNAGYGFAGDNGDDSLFSTPGLNVVTSPTTVAPVTRFGGGTFFNSTGSSSRDGFVGGGQIGYNWQLTPGAGWVFGIEADVQYADLNRSRNNNNAFVAGGGSGLFLADPVGAAVPFGIAAPTAGSGGNNIALFNNGGGLGNRDFGGGSDWFATVRGRLGYAWDRVLVYATGGVAFTDVGSRNNNVFGFGFANSGAIPAAFFVSPAAIAAAAGVAPGAVFFNNNRPDDVGYAVGGGVEYAFYNNWTVKLEGLYVNFGNSNGNNNVAAAAGVVGVSNRGAPITAAALGVNTGRQDTDFGVVRVGLNYKFSTW